MYQLQPYRPIGNLFNLRRGSKRSPAMILSIGLIMVMWPLVFFFGFLRSDGGASVFLLFGLTAVGTIAIPILINFGWQALVNTRLGQAELRVNNDRIYRGEELRCEFIQPVKGRVAIRDATIQLVLHEWVKYRQGTSTYTKTHNEVIDEMVFEGEQKNSGEQIWLQTQFRIPQNAMHNINYSNNRLQWLVVVKVNIPAFPDYYEEFALDFKADR
ncbi:MAG: hypothetical protein Q9P01_12490 [Anaerolineae bacterium]|nr:hypothetical protein [Anaerolineae bacterium]MDQ7035613.1 hypothetical protein [Anaerolineae bacterium]